MADPTPNTFTICRQNDRWVVMAPDGSKLPYWKTVEIWDEAKRRMVAHRIEYVNFPTKAAAIERLAEYAWQCHERLNPPPPPPMEGQRTIHEALQESSA